MSNLVLKPLSDIYTQDEVRVLKNLVCKDLSDDELRVFGHVCARAGLDPFAKQIYAVKRDGKLTIQTAIDGFRLIAFRTGKYAGRDETKFDYENNKLIRAKVTIYKMVEGVRCGYTATANWDEYYPGEKMGFMWRKLPETMLEKCAESKALRMAFPAELSGLYTSDEMAQADRPNETKADEVREIIKNAEPIKDDAPLSEYRISFGKYEGRKISDVDVEELRSYVKWIKDEAARLKKPIEGRGLELVQAVEAFLEERVRA